MHAYSPAWFTGTLKCNWARIGPISLGLSEVKCESEILETCHTDGEVWTGKTVKMMVDKEDGFGIVRSLTGACTQLGGGQD